MKLISIMIPCFNEVDNVEPISDAIIEQLKIYENKYDFELVFIDNFSTDGTREKLEKLCSENKKIKAIFNAKNFGQFNSPFYGMCQVNGDCVISMCCDFQDPVDLIPRFITEWEKGYKIVAAIKTTSEENKFIRCLRTCYYKLIKKMSSVEQIEHFTGTGLYDRSFIEVLKNLDDPQPFLRGIVAELGPLRKDIPYTQAKRRTGKTHNNWYTLYDAAMLSFTSYTKIGLRLATIFGFIFSGINMLIGLGYLIAKLIWWDKFPLGTTPMLLGIFFTGSIQLFFIGLLGEYVLNINTRVMKRPLVVEEKRINF